MKQIHAYLKTYERGDIANYWKKYGYLINDARINSPLVGVDEIEYLFQSITPNQLQINEWPMKQGPVSLIIRKNM